MPAPKAPTSLRRLFEEIGTVDHVGIEERVVYASLSRWSI
jgi:hypothetical protein